MANQSAPSRLNALITLLFFVGILLTAGWLVFNSVSSARSSTHSSQPTPTPTPIPGTFNIDDKLDMLN